ncbi:MAG: PIN domain-containing protein [Lachnospiraceae bacterium]
MNKILIDTNIIIDVMAERSPHFTDSLSVLESIFLERTVGYITSSTITDIFYIINKKMKNSESAKQSIGKLLEIIDVLNVTKDDIISALASKMDDFENSVLASCGVRNNIDFIVSRNKKDFKNSPIQTLTPTEYLRELQY